MYDEEKIKQYIMHLYDPDKKTREDATKSLVDCGKMAVLPLISILDDPEWTVRYRAAEALGMIRDERAINPLAKKLKDPKDHVRYMAAKDMGYFGNKELSISLLPLLKDDNEYVRRIASVSLGILGGNTAYNALLKAAESEKDERTAEAIKDAIIKINPNI